MGLQTIRTSSYAVLFTLFTHITEHMYFLSIGVHILVSTMSCSYHLHTVQNTCICIHTLVSTMSCSYHLHTVQNTRIFHLKVFTYHHPFILTIHLKFPIFIIDKQPVSSTIIIQRDWLWSKNDSMKSLTSCHNK